MPVATVRTFASKIMSRGSKPAFSTSSLYARWQTEILSESVEACPRSSNAITTAAAPNFIISRACERNFSSPSFRLIELTTHLPCEHFKPAKTVSQFDESIISGTRAISGSEPMRLRNFDMHAGESSMPSSKLMSMRFAPFST